MPNENNDVIVSVFMITYNHEKYIAEALDSILMQEVDFRYEIVVGEDCSTDNTRQILLEYRDKYPDKFKLLLHNENIGMMPNVISTLKACTGKYIAMLEGDDYWADPLKLQKQVDFLDDHEKYICTFHNYSVVDEDGNILIQSQEKYKGLRDYNSDEMCSGATAIPTLTVMFRNVALDIPHEFESVYNGDTAIWHLLGFFGESKYQQDIECASYRIHSNGVWGSLQQVDKLKKSFLTLQTLKKNPNISADIENKLNRNLELLMLDHLASSLYSLKISVYFRVLSEIFNDKEKRKIFSVSSHFIDVISRAKRKIRSSIKKNLFGLNNSMRSLKIHFLEENIRIGKNVTIGKNVIIKTTDGGRIIIEDNVSIESNSFLYAQKGEIIIGKNSFIGFGSQIVAKKSIAIGNDCLVSAYSIIRDANHGTKGHIPISLQPHDIKAIIIEGDVWLGAHTVVTAGSSIGQGAVVGANAVVTKDIESYTIVGGVPARFIKKRVD
ncbi:glycosyltransferase [Sulfurovum sp.]|uniref:glycosyltransferase n=1 Tax=Sulfurovum sp. TaxID=1969726 RepID=UPI00356831FC